MGVRGIAGLGALALLPGLPLAAAPVATVSDLPEAARLIDIRPEAECLSASLPEARCVPASVLLGEGAAPPVGFHALRWLLGTVGLTGAEPVAIFPADADGALAVAALMQLAGQSTVVVYDGPAEMTGRGSPRSFSREAVYTAPLRIAALRVAEDTTAPLRQQLETFARGDARSVAFAPDA
jgi:hypothetical protein